MTLTEIEMKIAAIETLAHAISCKRCQRSYEKIIMHSTDIHHKIIDEIIASRKREEDKK